mgnify:CR=1 FL=1
MDLRCIAGAALIVLAAGVAAAEVDLRKARVEGKGPVPDATAAFICTGAKQLEGKTVTRDKYNTHTTTTTRTMVIEYLQWMPPVSSESVPAGIRLPCKNCEVYPIKIGGKIRSIIAMSASKLTPGQQQEQSTDFRRIGYVGKDLSFDQWFCSTKPEGKA